MGRSLEICILARELLQQSGMAAIGMERNMKAPLKNLVFQPILQQCCSVKIDSVILDLLYTERQFIIG